jgi:hypothetical protein
MKAVVVDPEQPDNKGVRLVLLTPALKGGDEVPDAVREFCKGVWSTVAFSLAQHCVSGRERLV